ncbi:MAG: glutaredoxin family protein [Candidatus Accumulibacter sp.]|uniref:glutaredoxin family protein n=1 Tax=Accumulibacter sp. TaxID=2053492 RepID=UPI0019E3F63A|nr:glutaredoxin family protein [Accumulibacter sp.]MBE2257840.1 glutaredoxin family protein [Paracoccaceae bacterium]MCP5249281.1 glutaredoxin family protein [Accumulibacter sp.]
MLAPARRRIARIALMLLATTAVSAQTTYRWLDPTTGRTVISDLPPPPGARQVVIYEGSGAGEPQPLSYATRQASEKFPVVLYTSAGCSACEEARALLNRRGVPFSEKLLRSQEELTELGRQLGGNATLPSVTVGRQSATGFVPGHWNELLDLAGYPATAPYGFTPSGPPAQ